MAKKYLRESRASGSTLQRVNRIARRGARSVRRQFVAADRRTLRQLKEGGTNGQ